MMPGSSRNSPWTDRKRELLAKMRAEGFRTKEIALRLGVSSGSVTSEARRQGLPKRQSPIKSKELPT